MNQNTNGQPGGDLYRLLSVADLAALPAPDFLLDEMVPRGGFSVLYGPSGVGKSFLGIDWSMAVASGLAWYGQRSTAGWVVYIAAEGSAGLGVRVRAWQEARGQPTVERIRFLPDAVNFLDPQQLNRACRTIAMLPEPPALIVIDTMARTMVGGEENSAKDVGLFIAAVDRLRRPHGAASLVIHHTGKSSEDERGSSALRGAADMMHALKADGASLRLECAKAKDCEPYKPWRLHLEQVAESCILRCGTDTERLAPAELQILAAVSEAFGTDAASPTAIRDAAGVPKSSYYRSIKRLQDKGFLAADDGATKRLRLSHAGLAQLVPSSPIESHGSGETSPTHTPTLRGWDSGPGLDLSNHREGS
jgi:hypothetical protein